MCPTLSGADRAQGRGDLAGRDDHGSETARAHPPARGANADPARSRWVPNGRVCRILLLDNGIEQYLSIVDLVIAYHRFKAARHCTPP